MKRRTIPVGQLYIERFADEDELEDYDEYIDQILPLIGEVVFFFNLLERDLDSWLCFYISDRTDQKGLMVLHSMNYSTKVDLFQRAADDILRMNRWDLESYTLLLKDLRECAAQRNRVVHADWRSLDTEKYTQVKIRIGKDGLEHEMWQLTPDGLEEVVSKIIATRECFDTFIEELDELYSQQEREVEERFLARQREGDSE